MFRSKNTLPGTIYPPFSLRLTFQLLPVYSQAPVSVVSRVCLRPSVLRCWRALLLCVLPFCDLFPRTYIRRRLIPYYDSGPLHKHQIYIRPIFHFCNLFPRTYIRRRLIPYYDSGPLHKHQVDFFSEFVFEKNYRKHSSTTTVTLY